jgi:hypothetical protein
MVGAGLAVGMGGVAAIQGMTFVAVVAGTRIVPQPQVKRSALSTSQPRRGMTVKRAARLKVTS